MTAICPAAVGASRNSLDILEADDWHTKASKRIKRSTIYTSEPLSGARMIDALVFVQPVEQFNAFCLGSATDTHQEVAKAHSTTTSPLREILKNDRQMLKDVRAGVSKPLKDERRLDNISKLVPQRERTTVMREQRALGIRAAA